MLRIKLFLNLALAVFFLLIGFLFLNPQRANALNCSWADPSYHRNFSGLGVNGQYSCGDICGRCTSAVEDYCFSYCATCNISGPYCTNNYTGCSTFPNVDATYCTSYGTDCYRYWSCPATQCVGTTYYYGTLSCGSNSTCIYQYSQDNSPNCGGGSSGKTCDTCSSGYGSCSASCGTGSQTCTLDQYTAGATDDPCTVLHGGYYYYGGACNSEKTMLYQCGGSPNHGSGSSTSHQVCNCQVNNGTYDTCNGQIACTQGTSSQTCNTQPCPWNGVCGATHYNCDVGNSTGGNGDSTNGWTWTCTGGNGGNNASCSEGPGAINAVCGATHYNCDVGNSTGGSGNSTNGWTWTCTGLNGGNNASCSEGPAVVNGVCGATHYNCNVGSLGATADYSNQWQWWCNGANGGSNALCSQNKPNCNTGGGSCSACNPSCGPGSQTCTYTTYSGGGECVPQTYTQSCNLGTCNYNITVNSFVDNNHDGNWDQPTEPAFNGNISYSGTKSGSGSTGTDGTMAIANVPSGTENVTLTNLPAGWSIMPGNPQSASGPPDATVNFALEPSSPTCSSVRVTPNSTIYQGQAATVTATCQGAAGQQVSYYWQIPTGQLGTVDDTGTNATTYHAPANVQPNGTITDPTVVVCNPGVTPPSPLCKAYSATVTILPYFTISGNVFVDADRDKILDHGETNYTGTINISTTAGNVSYPSSGAFTISNLPAGEYYVTLAKVSGYEFTTSPTLSVKVGPNNGQGPSGSGIILTKCDPEVSGASCGANGDITDLKFGISNSYPWIQTGSAGGLPPGVGFSGDSSFASGVENPIPSTATLCTPYSSLNGPQGTPGVINSGNVAPSFCSGGDPGCLNLSSSPQWVTGGAAYPDPFKPSNLGIIKTSFGYMSSLAQAGGVDLTSNSSDLAQYCSGGIANCTLSSSIPHGVYIAKGNLTLVGSGYTFPSGQNFVILVNGDLTIKEEIHVPTGSTVLFTTSKNIYIDSGVGESSITSTASDIEGFYSADQSFIVQKGPGVSCPASDNRLNIAGSIVVNAGLNGGTFQNQRDLCAGDIQCPSVYIGGRPDLIINSPQFIWSTKKVWQEITP